MRHHKVSQGDGIQVLPEHGSLEAGTSRSGWQIPIVHPSGINRLEVKPFRVVGKAFPTAEAWHFSYRPFTQYAKSMRTGTPEGEAVQESAIPLAALTAA